MLQTSKFSLAAIKDRNMIFRCARILDRHDRKKLATIVLVLVFLNFLDLIGVAIVGIVGALTISGFQSQAPGDRTRNILELLNLENYSLQSQVALLGALAAILLISKTFFSIYFSRKIIFFLSRKGASISANLISRVLSQDLLNLQKMSSQEILYSVTAGVGIITLGIISVSLNLLSDISLLLILFSGLFLVEPSLSMITIFIFSLVGFFLYKLLHVKAKTLGKNSSTLNILSNEKILEVLNSYRESIVRNRRHFYATEIGKLRFRLADIMAEQTFMPNISKYVIEITVVVSILGISAMQFLLQDATRAVGVLSVFLAASARIAPAVLRVQQGAIQVKSNIGAASQTLKLIDSLIDINSHLETPINDVLNPQHLGFKPKVKLAHVSFGYAKELQLNLNNINLEVEAGDSLALIGASGVGKTTLVDILLGVITPDKGTVEISGCSSREAIARWPGAIAYVPQDVLISNGTVRENITLGYPQNIFPEEKIWECLKIAQIDDFVRNLELGLDTPLQDRGTRLSGGQRQRLGIARALITSPKLLVLDEATSSLDGQTEFNLAEALNQLKGKVTLIMIAHRLSSIKNVKTVAYIENGVVKKLGSYTEVVSEIRDIEREANLSID